MISRYEVEKAILEHESKDTSYANCERLAWLYIVRDHLTGAEMLNAGLFSPTGESDFIKAASGKDGAAVWSVLDELMETLRITNPRLYDGVMRRLDAVG